MASSRTLKLFLLINGALVAYGLAALALSTVVMHVRYVGYLDAVAYWTPLAMVFWTLSIGASAAMDRGANLSPKFMGVFLFGPIFAYAYGKVGELGALLYVALPMLAVYGVIRAERQARAAAAPANGANAFAANSAPSPASSFVGDK
jgi:hypothetical protein